MYTVGGDFQTIAQIFETTSNNKSKVHSLYKNFRKSQLTS